MFLAREVWIERVVLEDHGHVAVRAAADGDVASAIVIVPT